LDEGLPSISVCGNERKKKKQTNERKSLEGTTTAEKGKRAEQVEKVRNSKERSSLAVEALP
jgi:hypothetical protein